MYEAPRMSLHALQDPPTTRAPAKFDCPQNNVSATEPCEVFSRQKNLLYFRQYFRQRAPYFRATVPYQPPSRLSVACKLSMAAAHPCLCVPTSAYAVRLRRRKQNKRAETGGADRWVL